jgi:hypothetical protein
MTRHRELKRATNVAKLPYHTETIRLDSDMNYETHIRKKHSNDEALPPARHFIIHNDGRTYVINDEYFSVIKGMKGSTVHLYDCGLVIISGEVNVVVCGKVHTIISGSDVYITFDTVSEEQIEEDSYLFVESSNAYDSVGRWNDMTHEKLMMLKDDNVFNQEQQIIPHVLNKGTHQCRQAIVRLLIYEKLPANLYTARIQAYYLNSDE